MALHAVMGERCRTHLGWHSARVGFGTDATRSTDRTPTLLLGAGRGGIRAKRRASDSRLPVPRHDDCCLGGVKSFPGHFGNPETDGVRCRKQFSLRSSGSFGPIIGRGSDEGIGGAQPQGRAVRKYREHGSRRPPQISRLLTTGSAVDCFETAWSQTASPAYLAGSFQALGRLEWTLAPLNSSGTT